MTMPYLSAVSMTLSSRMLPPGWATYLTPLAAARSMLSPKGRRRRSRGDTAEFGQEAALFVLRELLADKAVYLIVALRPLEAGGELESSTFGWRRRCQRSALSPARRVAVYAALLAGSDAYGLAVLGVADGVGLGVLERYEREQQVVRRVIAKFLVPGDDIAQALPVMGREL